MRFANIDLKEIGAVFVVRVKFDEVADPATKRRSSVAAENQDERFCADAIAQMKCGCAIERVKFRVAGVVANAKIAAVHIGQRVTDEAVNILGASGHHAKKTVGERKEKSERDRGPFQNASPSLRSHDVPLLLFDFQQHDAVTGDNGRNTIGGGI
jgi:hypothetical protein